MEDVMQVEGIVENIIFHNKENGYCVFSLLLEDTKKTEIVCVGSLPELLEGEQLQLTGKYIVHSAYGKQFQIETCIKSVPTTVQGMQRYLGSGVIKGIGEKMAKKIVDKFGEHTFEIIEKEPERIADIKGITMQKAMSIHATFVQQAELRATMIYLQNFGISPTYATKIYKKYKERTIQVIENNPYILAEDIYGIGFKVADEIAMKAGVEIDSAYRVKAGIKYSLSMNANNGHVYMIIDDMVDMLRQLLNVNVDSIQNILTEMQVDGVIVVKKIDGRQVVYLSSYFYAENYVAKKLIELSKNVIDKSSDVEHLIKKIEKETKIHLADNQKLAVQSALQYGVLAITGGPGTGKTTTINTIIKMLELDNYDVVLTAPTGRASKRMSETTGLEAKTIHRLLGVTFGDDTKRVQSFDKNEDNPIEADVIIVDESSMIDIMLMQYLLKATEIGTRIIFVGDVDQLPSVGAGNVLKDIIRSEVIHVVKLQEIFRQAQTSAIITNAHKINKGEYPSDNSKDSDFFIMKRNTPDEIINTVCDLVTTRLPKFLNCDSKEDIQILTPMRKSPVGVNNLNMVLQQRLNPKSHNKKEKDFREYSLREGDKVMQMKNNYSQLWKIVDDKNNIVENGIGVFNGDEGRIVSINEFDETVTVKFDDNKIADYDYSQLDELDLSYAITVHKSQGSEYKVVIIPIYNAPSMLLSRNLLYTAVTRGKSMVVLVGRTDVIKNMVENNREINRNSSLHIYLQELYEYLK